MNLHSTGSFYNYEPLTYTGVRRIYQKDDQKWVLSAKKVVEGLINCNFSVILNECKEQLL